MQEAGFFAQKRNSPTSLGLVILLHGALISAVVLIKSPAFIRALDPPIVVTPIPIDPDAGDIDGKVDPWPRLPERREERLRDPPLDVVGGDQDGHEILHGEPLRAADRSA